MVSSPAPVAAVATADMRARRRRPERWSARLSGGGSRAATVPAGAAPAPPARPAAAGASLERRRRALERAREVEDSPSVLRDKCRRLARALANAKHLVVYTGAGISTAADIPDYRGPRGVWTRLAAGERAPRAQVAQAAPTYTHMALTQLFKCGLLKFVVSQNCDGLHIRSGLPRRALAELHGNMFAERCPACARVYLRAFDTSTRTARHAHGTRRLCHGCGEELQDTIVHFGERGAAAWPLNWAGALRHSAAADVVLCLGSSLKVLRRYPRLWRMHAAPSQRPRLYIVNLQWTPKDAVAELKINARCDDVMAAVARRLRLAVPPYCPRRDPLLWHAEPLAPQEAHTARGPRLPPPALVLPHAPVPPHAAPDSDPEDDLPLCRLRRAPDPPAIPPQPPPPEPPPLAPPELPSQPQRPSLPQPRILPPQLPPQSPPPTPPTQPLPLHPTLHSFQVSLVSGAATILLRARESGWSNGVNGATSESQANLAPWPLSRDTGWNGVNGASQVNSAASWPLSSDTRGSYGVNGASQANSIPPWSLSCDTRGSNGMNGANSASQANSAHWPLSRLRLLLDQPASSQLGLNTRPSCDDVKDIEKKVLPKEELEIEIKEELKEETKESVEMTEEWSWAAAIIARAVVVCRAQLYPGLHTIVGAAGAGAGVGAGCAWCGRRCGWYGPPALTPVARRVQPHQRLCACCGPGDPRPDDPPLDTTTPGWFGKGYRKGRRKKS